MGSLTSRYDAALLPMQAWRPRLLNDVAKPCRARLDEMVANTGGSSHPPLPPAGSSRTSVTRKVSAPPVTGVGSPVVGWAWNRRNASSLHRA